MEPQIQITESAYDPQWDEFVARTPGGHHVQSALWAQLKTSRKWKTIRILATENGHILAGAQLLMRAIVPSMPGVLYLTKGPLLEREDMNLAKRIVTRVCEISEKTHSLILAIQPPNNGCQIASCLPEWGFQPSKLELAPVASLVLDLTPPLEQILDRMKRQTRQNIRRGGEAGMTVRDGSGNDLDIFYAFHVVTSGRQGFYPYPKEYYVRMRQLFEPRGYFKMFMAEWNGKTISSLLVIPFGDTVIAKVIGWSGEHPQLRPNDFLFWNAIQWSKKTGYRCFDFEGIDVEGAKAILAGESLPDHLQHSPDFFKLGYGGEVVLYPQTFERVPNPVVNWFYKKASPSAGSQSLASRMVDRFRKV